MVKPFKQAFTLSTCTFQRDGYEFIGWNTQPDGTGEKYEAGETISLSANTTLYAQWKEIHTKENMHNGHEYVDLGLPSGTLWATCNVGADYPEEYGDYFAWGETTPKEEYKEENYKWYNKENSYLCTKYNYQDKQRGLDKMDDTAQVNWGGDWRMPGLSDIKELCIKCTWIYFTLRGSSGIK